MELTLKIYKGKKVEKEYKTDTIDCSFGVVEDILDALDFESMKNGTNAEIAATVIKCSKQLKPFLKDIFKVKINIQQFLAYSRHLHLISIKNEIIVLRLV